MDRADRRGRLAGAALPAARRGVGIARTPPATRSGPGDADGQGGRSADGDPGGGQRGDRDRRRRRPLRRAVPDPGHPDARARRLRAAPELLRSHPVARALGHRPDAAQSVAGRRLPGHPRSPAELPPGHRRLRRRCDLREPRADQDRSRRRGTVLSPLDLYVVRRPPSPKHFLSQRVRQAYDDLAIPPRMAAWLGVVPGLALCAFRDSWRPPPMAAAGLVVLAEVGRRRAGGRRFFPAAASLFAPLWVLERGVCSWLAVRERLVRGGAAYGGGTVPRAASSMRRLRRRFANRTGLAERNG